MKVFQPRQTTSLNPGTPRSIGLDALFGDLGQLFGLPSVQESATTTPEKVTIPTVNGINSYAESLVSQANRISDALFQDDVNFLRRVFNVAEGPARAAAALLQAGQVFTDLAPLANAALKAGDFEHGSFLTSQIEAAYAHEMERNEQDIAAELRHTEAGKEGPVNYTGAAKIETANPGGCGGNTFPSGD